MTVEKFMNLANYGELVRPQNVSPPRWAGMLKWLAKAWQLEDHEEMWVEMIFGSNLD